MNAWKILGEIKKQQTILQVPDADLIRVSGMSPATYKRRMKDPDRMSIGEMTAICNYLGIKSL